MKVTVRTILRLGGHLPSGGASGGQANEIALEVPAETTPWDVMRRLGLSEDRLYLVKVNGAVLPLARHGAARLKERDELTILPKPKYG